MLLSDMLGKFYNEGTARTTNHAREHLGRRFGSAFDERSFRQRWERAVVMEVYPSHHTCDVYTSSGALLTGVGFPAGGARVPRRGEYYAVHYDLGTPALEELSADARDVAPEDTTNSTQVTPLQGIGADDPQYANTGIGSMRGNRPGDVIPGDYVLRGGSDTLLGLLEGGSVVLKASELAQLIMTQARSMVRLVGKNVRMDSGAGIVALRSEDGKCTLDLELGADETTETNPRDEHFRIRAQIGHDGELVDFRVMDGRGRTTYRMHVDPDGRVETVAEQLVSDVRGDRAEYTGGSVESEVVRDRTVVVGGDDVLTTSGAILRSAEGDARTVSGKDAELSALRDAMVTARRALYFASGGEILGSGPSMQFSAVNGPVSFDVGNPLNGDTLLRSSDFTVDTWRGDISLRSVAGSIALHNTIPGGCKIGGPGPGLFHAVLWETFELIINQMALLFDTHTHVIPSMGGAATSPAIPPTMSAQTAALLPLSKSLFVKFGG